MCCIHTVNTFFSCFYTKKEQFLQGSSPLSGTELWNNRYDLELVSLGQDNQDRDKGLLKEMFPGWCQSLQSCSTVSFHSTDSKHRNTAFSPVTYNNTDITVLRHSAPLLSLRSLLYRTQGSPASRCPASLPPFLSLSSAPDWVWTLGVVTAGHERPAFSSSLSHNFSHCFSKVLHKPKMQTQDALGVPVCIGVAWPCFGSSGLQGSSERSFLCVYWSQCQPAARQWLHLWDHTFKKGEKICTIAADKEEWE